jgi:hypothetical protein
MKKTFVMIAAGAALAGVAMAQEDHLMTFDKAVPQIRVMGLQGSMMGRTVKNAPYSAVEVTEHTQMLADGTRIHNESQTQVYRDSEGRMRRETPTEITIWDPVAGASWMLNTKNQTARKLPMGNFSFTTARTPNGEVATYTMRSSSGPEAGRMILTEDVRVIEGKAAEVKHAEARMKAEIESHVRANATAGVMVAGPTADLKKVLVAQRMKMNTESLGKRMIEGVNSEGTKHISTTEAGAIGNDRPIQSVTERWFSPELQTVMLTRSNDPRTGEDVFRLINVSRSEPPAYLFQVPAGYQVLDGKVVLDGK